MVRPKGVVTYSSTYVLVALSVDRCDAITHPMNFTGSWRRARALILGAWFVSFLFCVPMLFLFDEANVEDSDDLDSRRASSRGIIPKAKIKTVKMTFVIVFVFVLCWSPYMIFDLLQVYGYVPDTQGNIAIASLIQSLAPLNSAANPVIYFIFSNRIFVSLRCVGSSSW
ncbi:hypothetical protein HF086_009565 [Spodoptera exigua]|uniref:G-protein coupled receptors family 1 profile domain-containing protein n=1 Tax=Spodoptera exigua TaxID=7107 RepID=A0A922M3K2_SPOEX|nr:hypothetical protein HF086_009565 [Spodoptera exigua]